MAADGPDNSTPPAHSGPRLLLVTTRPVLQDASGSLHGERVLDDAVCNSLNLLELCLPAFCLRVRAAVLPDLVDWFSHCNPTPPAPFRASATSEASETSPARLPLADLVVIVSPGSLALLRAHLPDPWPAGLLLGLMGDGSAAKAVALGIPAQALVYPQQSLGQGQDSAGLLALLRQQDNGHPGYGRILLLQGDRGNQDLAPALQACCQSMTTLHAYHREPQLICARQIERLQAHSQHSEVLFYLTSSEAVSVLAPAVMACSSSAVRVWVTHPRIEQAAHKLGLPNVETLAPGAAVLRARIAQLGS